MARANGEGSIYPKGDGFEVALIVHGRRRTARAKTITEANAGTLMRDCALPLQSNVALLESLNVQAQPPATPPKN